MQSARENAEWARGREDAGRGAGSVAELLREVLVAADLVRPAMAARLNLGVTDLRAMEHLVTEPIGPAELARRLHLTTAATTVLLDRLEYAGHVRRVAHPSDARRRVVVVTEQGLGSVLGEVRPMVEELDAATDALDAAGRAAVAGYLAAVRDALARAARPDG